MERFADSDRAFEYSQANQGRYAEHRASILAERKMAKTGYLDSFNDVRDSVSDVMDDAIGAVKQIGNNLIASQRAMLAEHLADNGVVQVTDTATGKILSPDEVAKLYGETETFEISDSEKGGANAIKSIPAYGSVLLAAETVGTRGRNVVRDPESFVSDVIGSIVKPKIKLKGGGKGGWNKVLNTELDKNTKYSVDGYIYETDDLKRVTNISGELTLNKRARNTYQQGKSAKVGGIKDASIGDEGGHIIGARFNGLGEQINYVPMTKNMNRGAWKSMENKWEKALNEGKNVSVNILPKYKNNSSRPDSIIAEYSIDGEKSKVRFKNK